MSGLHLERIGKVKRWEKQTLSWYLNLVFLVTISQWLLNCFPSQLWGCWGRVDGTNLKGENTEAHRWGSIYSSGNWRSGITLDRERKLSAGSSESGQAV